MMDGCYSNLTTTTLLLKVWASTRYLFVSVCAYGNCRNEFLVIINGYVEFNPTVRGLNKMATAVHIIVPGYWCVAD